MYPLDFAATRVVWDLLSDGDPITPHYNLTNKR